MTSTDIAKVQASALQAAQAMLGGLTRVVNDAPSGGGDYLRFGKDGIWSFGTDNKEVDPENDLAVLNVLSLQAGFVCWTNYPKEEKKKNEKLGERMAPVTQPIDVNTLPDHGWDWRAQQMGEFKFIEGAYVGTQVKFVTSAQGGLERFAALLSTVKQRVQEGTPYFFPIVAFDGDYYIHPSWGKTYKPLFEIVAWADVNGNEEPEGGAPVIEQQPEPDPEPPVEETPQDEAPEEKREPEPTGGPAAAVSEEPKPRRRRRR